MSIHETAASLLSYALQSGLLLLVGLIAPRLVRLRHPRTLLIYWRLLLPAVLLLPLATAVWQPQKTLPLLALDGAVVEEVVATALPPEINGFSWIFLLVPILLVTALALSRIALGLMYLKRCRRTAKPVDPLPNRVRGLQRRLGLKVPFFVAERLSVPITFGWARPIVMVPPSFYELSEDEQEGVACHELLHIHRGDWLVTLFEEFLRAVLWFHPAVWLLLPRISLSREQVVDAGTVELTGKRRQYLDALWQIVVACQAPAAVAVPMVGKSHLRARVERLKKEIVMSKTRITVSVVVLSVMVAVAGYVGASAFSASVASTGDQYSLAKPWSTGDEETNDDEQPAKKTKRQLETTDFSGECAEITHPEVLEKVNPKYPEEARKAKITGRVILRSTINETGVVEDLEVLESPDESLSVAAADAVKQWHFKPALCDGKPVGVYYNLTVNFNLK